MTKVEELREKVLRYKAGEYVGRDIEDGYTTEDICIVHTDDLDSLIAAAREEARAEGAEQERERIRKESLHYAEGEPLEGTDAESVEGDEAIAQQEMFIIPASVLAPAGFAAVGEEVQAERDADRLADARQKEAEG